MTNQDTNELAHLTNSEILVELGLYDHLTNEELLALLMECE